MQIEKLYPEYKDNIWGGVKLKEKYGKPRKTQIDYDMEEINYEDLIQEKPIVISISNRGYIKRTPLSLYKAQNRGGRGVKGATAREDDFIKEIIATTTHAKLMFFTNFGKVYTATGYDVPEAGKNAKGTPVINLINIQSEERVQCIVAIDKDFDKKYVTFATKLGFVKRMEFDEIAKEYAGKVAFMMVDLTDGVQETQEKAQAFIDSMGYTFPVYFDKDSDAAYKYGIQSIPTTIFIDANGNLIAGATGAIDGETLRYGISMIYTETE